jgi:hypothetical protein
MLRRLVAIFSLICVFGAGLHTSGFSMGPRSFDATSDIHLSFDPAGQERSGKWTPLDSDSDAVKDNLISADFPDGFEADENRVFPLQFSQGQGATQFFVATLSLPWPYLAALQRPPRLA